MAPHVDAISVNYNVDTADGWIAPYFFDGLRDLSGGKRSVTEWFYAAAENRSGNLNRTGPPREGAEARISNNLNRTGHLMTVATQQERARGAGRAAQLLAAAPNVIGVHWFQYADEPTGGRVDGEDYNFGLVDIGDRPYFKLICLAGQQPAGALGHGPPHRPRTRRGSRPCPAAGLARADDADAGGLAEGGLAGADDRLPLRGALVPRFGLAWNEYGLFLATIAMDYYAPELLGPLAEFPRSEAFRIALGLEAGAGPRRIELRVVPHPTVQIPNQKPKLSFDAQICWYQQSDDCAAVAGATALYFGTALDQPRVILKAFIPWHQLGLSGPPHRAGMRIEVGVTAFYRSRWMSRSGLAPEIAMNDPSSWLPVRLGVRRGTGQRESPASTAAERSNRTASRCPAPRAASAVRARNRGGSSCRCGRLAGRHRASDSRRSRRRASAR